MGFRGEGGSVITNIGEERDRIDGNIFIGIRGFGVGGPCWWGNGFDLHGSDTHVLAE